MVRDWLYKHRYSLTAVGLILVAVLVIAMPIFGFVRGYFSESVARLLMVGIGAFGTVLLATITLLTLVNNRVLVNEQLKEREKPLMEDMLQKIVWPAIESLDENQEKLRSRRMEWSIVDKRVPGTAGIEHLGFELIGQRGDPLTSDRFADRFPETTDKMVEYDKKLIRLGEFAHDIVKDIRDPTRDLIESNDIRTRQDDLANVGYVVDLLLNADHAPDAQRPDFWVEHRDDYREVALKHREDTLEEFYDLRREILNYSNEVRRFLVDVRKEIEPEYGIYLQE